MFAAKAFYFFYFGALACLMPYLSLYYNAMGLTGAQIGVLSGLGPLMGLVSGPLWSGLADAASQHKRLMLIAIGGVMAAVLLMAQVHTFALLLAAVALYSFALAPVMSMADQSVVASLGDRSAEYGRQRLWGSVGWGLIAPLMGWVAERVGLGVIFYGFALVMAGTWLAAARLPIRHAKLSAPFWQGFRQLVTNRPWMLFVAVVGLGMMCRSASSFLFLHLQTLGAEKTLLGFSLTMSSVGELPSFFFSARLLRRFGARGLLTLGLLLSMLMFVGLSLLRVPWPVLIVQLATGLSFSAMWTAGVAYCHEMAPPGMGATAQGVFSALGMGLAMGTGSLLSGALYDAIGAVWLFRLAALGSLAAVGAFVALSAGVRGRGSGNRASNT